jgi:hypothetical protein
MSLLGTLLSDDVEISEDVHKTEGQSSLPVLHLHSFLSLLVQLNSNQRKFQKHLLKIKEGEQESAISRNLPRSRRGFPTQSDAILNQTQPKWIHTK